MSWVWWLLIGLAIGFVVTFWVFVLIAYSLPPDYSLKRDP